MFLHPQPGNLFLQVADVLLCGVAFHILSIGRSRKRQVTDINMNTQICTEEKVHTTALGGKPSSCCGILLFIPRNAAKLSGKRTAVEGCAFPPLNSRGAHQTPLICQGPNPKRNPPFIQTRMLEDKFRRGATPEQ